MKHSGSFHICAQNIDCGYSLVQVPAIYVLSTNTKINVYPCKPKFYCIKVDLRGSNLYRLVFVMSKMATV